MFCSIIIPTIGRATLSRAVCSVLDQPFTAAAFEVIVVNDSGRPLPEETWQRDERVRLINTMRRERSVARNAGAAIAGGQYLCFLDDDDWLLPGALQEIWALAGRDPDAVWLYGGIKVVTESGRVLAAINSGLNGQCAAQIMGGAWVPIQTSFVRSDAFYQAGGFNPAIGVTQDQDLCRRITLRGRVANTPAYVACLLRGESWSTSTNYQQAARNTRLSRDAVLDQPGAFSCLRASARSSYWQGRVLRVYLSTIHHNLRQKRITRATSRTLYGLLTLLLAGPHLFSLQFWNGVRADHVPDTLHFVSATAGETGPRTTTNDAL